MIISEAKVWNDLLIKINKLDNISQTFTETNIDFNKYKVIASFDEVKNTGGHSLELSVKQNL